MPCCVDSHNIVPLVDRALSPSQVHDLQRRLGALFFVVAGGLSGHYRLDLSKRYDRLTALRIAAHDAREAAYARRHGRWAPTSKEERNDPLGFPCGASQVPGRFTGVLCDMSSWFYDDAMVMVMALLPRVAGAGPLLGLPQRHLPDAPAARRRHGARRALLGARAARPAVRDPRGRPSLNEVVMAYCIGIG